MTKKRRYAASAAIGKILYVIGGKFCFKLWKTGCLANKNKYFLGYDTKTRLKSVEKLDLSEDEPQWQSCAPLLFRRALPAVCVHDSKYSLLNVIMLY